MTNDAGVPGAPRFDVVLRGYDRRQVDEHVDRLQRVLARMRSDLEIVRSQPLPAVKPGQRPDPNRPRPTPRPRPGAGPDTIGNFTDRMQSILAEAEAEAAEIRRNAHAAARAEIDGVRSQVVDLLRQRDGVLGELTRMRAQLEGMLAAPTTQMPARPPQPGHQGPPRPEQFRGAAPVSPPPQPDMPTHAPPGAGGVPGSSGEPRAQPPSGSAPPANPASTANPELPAPSGPSPSAPASSAATPPVPLPEPLPEPLPAGRSLAGQPSTVARADRATGKAAHRMPTGAYPAVAESEPSSLRPRTEPQVEPADLFRPKSDGRQAEPGDAEGRSAEETRRPAADGAGAEVDRTAVVQAVRPGHQPPMPAGAETTTVVGAVRPADTTLLTQSPDAVSRPDQTDGAATGPTPAGPEATGEAANGSPRNGSSSRSV